jgi:hypothetical protein
VGGVDGRRSGRRLSVEGKMEEFLLFYVKVRWRDEGQS